MQIFKEVLSLKLRTTEKQKNEQLIQLILHQLNVGGWWKGKKLIGYFILNRICHLGPRYAKMATVQRWE